MTAPNDELLWTAYRYSAGELSADEALAFEARLADDQTAREALAATVGLTEMVCAIERDALPRRAEVVRGSWMQGSWLQPAGWFVAVTAACIALVFVWRGNEIARPTNTDLASNSGQTGSASAMSEPVDADTELLWVMLDQAPVDEASGLVPKVAALESADATDAEAEQALDEINGDEVASDDVSLEDQNATPDWLLAAVMESKS